MSILLHHIVMGDTQWLSTVTASIARLNNLSLNDIQLNPLAAVPQLLHQRLQELLLVVSELDGDRRVNDELLSLGIHVFRVRHRHRDAVLF